MRDVWAEPCARACWGDAARILSSKQPPWRRHSSRVTTMQRMPGARHAPPNSNVPFGQATTARGGRARRREGMACSACHVRCRSPEVSNACRPKVSCLALLGMRNQALTPPEQPARCMLLRTACAGVQERVGGGVAGRAGPGGAGDAAGGAACCAAGAIGLGAIRALVDCTVQVGRAGANWHGKGKHGTCRGGGCVWQAHTADTSCPTRRPCKRRPTPHGGVRRRAPQPPALRSCPLGQVSTASWQAVGCSGSALVLVTPQSQ